MTADPRVALHTSDFDYHLPPELIAQFPTERRGESRLLVVDRTGRREPADRTFAEFPSLVAPGDVLVLNTTKVRHGRFLGRRPSGGPAEVLLVQPCSDGTWIAMGKPGSALRPGRRITLGDDVAIETVGTLEEGLRRVRFVGADAEQAMAKFGRLPLPPYIEREPGPDDDIRYQTVFADREASVAAPTAGLHFTPELMARLEAAQVHIVGLQLEVGPGTFRPVQQEDFTTHPMHAERFEIPATAAEAIADARRGGGAVWAIGTTVVRALESAAMEQGTVTPGEGLTRLLIAPGYQFRVVDHLLTNFHLPRSTLLMLVAAFAGYEATMDAYARAIQLRYRFYSYGDAMVVA